MDILRHHLWLIIGILCCILAAGCRQQEKAVCSAQMNHPRELAIGILPSANTKPYQVIYTTQKRADGVPSYYVLLDPVDLSSVAFKDEVKRVIREIVMQHGEQLSIELFDDKNALEIAYTNGTSQSLRTPKEDALIARHKIASYDGMLSTAPSPHYLAFFPATLTTSPAVGQYVGHDTKFDPTP